MKRDLVIIGGGPAGLAAAQAAWDAGLHNIVILERDKELGGILNQCYHSGFGLRTFHEEMTGPEFASRCVDRVLERGIPYKLDTMVLDIRPDRTVVAVNRADGLIEIPAKAVILAMGCRERPRGALNTPGFRPAGVLTAGTAQRLINVDKVLPGRDVVILGSGDIGLITARRLALAGAKVHLVAEIMPYSGGLPRNLKECLEEFDIPLKLSTTVVDIRGRRRVEGVTLAQVDGRGAPIPGTEFTVPCDTLVCSVGLIPENELSRTVGVALDPATGGPVVNDRLETSFPGVFACGNVLHVHELVDYVYQEAAAAGEYAAAYVGAEDAAGELIPIVAQNGVRYTVPACLRRDSGRDKVSLRFRVNDIYEDKRVVVYADGIPLLRKNKGKLAPSKMRKVTLDLTRLPPDTRRITVRLED